MRILPALLFAAACAAQPGARVPAAPGPRVPDEPPAQQAFRLLNQARVAGGCPALVWSDPAASVAQAHAADMADRNYFAHASPEGTSPGRRLMLAGIAWRRVGENIASNPGASGAQVATQWLESAPHRVNLMTCDFTHTGIGESRGHWVQLFYTPS